MTKAFHHHHIDSSNIFEILKKKNQLERDNKNENSIFPYSLTDCAVVCDLIQKKIKSKKKKKILCMFELL